MESVKSSFNIKGDNEYKLYVKNIPEEMKQEGLKNLFSRYGKVTKIVFLKHNDWAFVYYNSYKEAEYAIRDLNDKPPLLLRISFSKYENDKSNNQLDRIFQIPYDYKSNNKAITITNEEFQKSDCTQQKCEEIDSIIRNYKLTDAVRDLPIAAPQYKYNSLYPLPDNGEMYNPYENPDFVSTCILWIRDKISCDQYSERCIIFGREYTCCQTIEQGTNSKITNYSFGNDLLSSLLGKCKYCQKITKSVCSNCQAFYCNEICQESDWSKHTKECEFFLKSGIKIDKYSTENSIKSELNSVCSKDNLLLHSENYEKVLIIHIEDDNFWITKINDLEKLQSLVIKLQTQIPFLPKVKPIVNNIYAFQNSHLWQRVRLLDTEPMLIRFIDYGYTESVGSGNFFEIKEYEDIPPYAMKIRFLFNRETKNYQSGDVISIRKISTADDGTLCVAVKGESIENTDFNIELNFEETLKISNKICKVITGKNGQVDKFISILNSLSFDSSGSLQISEFRSDKICNCIYVPKSHREEFSKLFNNLTIKCNESEVDESYSPQTGDLICGLGEDDVWYRGYIVKNSSTTKLAAVDCATVISIRKVIPCPSSFLNICTFGVVCHFEKSPNIKLQYDDIFKLKMVKYEKKDDNEPFVTAKIRMDKQEKLYVTIRPWNPLSGVRMAKITNGSKVCIVVVRSHSLIYVRSLDPEDIENYNLLMQDVSRSALRAPYLKEPLIVGQMILAKCIDGNYYRAVISKIEENYTITNKVLVSFIDFGNVDFISIKHIKSIPAYLEKIPSCVCKVILRNVPIDKPMTKAVYQYITKFITNRTRLMCTFDGEPYKDGVYLKTEDGSIINRTIKKMLLSKWENLKNCTNCYLAENLNVAPLGEINKVSNVIFLKSIKNGFEYIMAPRDPELVTHIEEVLPGMLRIYGEKSEYYIPRQGELCIVLWNEIWYRGMCLKPKFEKNYDWASIFLVDYGDTVLIKYENIRIMQNDFLFPDALANYCTVVNFIPKEKFNDKILTRLSELLTPSTVVDVKIIRRIDYGLYELELPGIKKKLMDEGLCC